MASNKSESPPQNEDDSPEITFPDANIVAIDAVAGVLSSVLGPSSRDKLIIQQLASRTPTGPNEGPALDEFSVTSDGANILDALPIEHPIAPVLSGIFGPDQPDDTVAKGEIINDGVTSTVVLIGALLNEGQSLLDMGLHPYILRSGYSTGRKIALETLESESRQVSEFSDPIAVQQSIAKTALTGNDIADMKETWAKLAAEAVTEVGMPDEKSFVVRTISDGSIADSRLVKGAVLDRNKVAHDEMPKKVEDASILVLGGFENQGGLQDPDVPGDMSINLADPDSVTDYEELWDERREEMVERLVQEEIDVVVARSGISKEFREMLADHNIMGIRSVNSLDISQLAAAIGATVIKDPEDIDSRLAGKCGSVEELVIEPRQQRRKRRRMVVFEGCADPQSVAVLLRGVKGQIASQAETQLRKAAAAVAIANRSDGSHSGVVPGGGATEMKIADQVREVSTNHGSRIQLALEAFADATETLVSTLARNAAQDPYVVVPDLRSANDLDHPGISLPDGAVVDVIDAGIIDPTSVRADVYTTAVEVANIILNIDDAIDAEVTDTPPDPDDAHYDDIADQQRQYQKEHDIR